MCGLKAVRRLERGTAYVIEAEAPLTEAELRALGPLLHDRMTETLWTATLEPDLFHVAAPRPLRVVALGREGHAALARADAELGLALSRDGSTIWSRRSALGRDPTDVELMMFAQANSEHCRHKIFNADFIIDGSPSPRRFRHDPHDSCGEPRRRVVRLP